VNGVSPAVDKYAWFTQARIARRFNDIMTVHSNEITAVAACRTTFHE